MWLAPSGSPLPTEVAEVAHKCLLDVTAASSPAEVLALATGALPAAVVVGWPERSTEGTARSKGPQVAADAETLCRRLKDDPLTATIPLIVLASDAEGAAGDAARVAEWAEGTASAGVVAYALEVGADEALAAHLPRREKLVRLEGALRRSERDLAAHPATRLPGAPAVERRLAEEIAAGNAFALCYADLDRFKEYNDRYGCAEGDKVILLVAAIVREVVAERAPEGFVGHVGGDDFALVVAPEQVARCCDQIVGTFGALVPSCCDDANRRIKGLPVPDRRGSTSRTTVMSLSIGVAVSAPGASVTPSQAWALAAKMKDRAKELPGNTWLAGCHEPRRRISTT